MRDTGFKPYKEVAPTLNTERVEQTRRCHTLATQVLGKGTMSELGPMVVKGNAETAGFKVAYDKTIALEGMDGSRRLNIELTDMPRQSSDGMVTQVIEQDRHTIVSFGGRNMIDEVGGKDSDRVGRPEYTTIAVYNNTYKNTEAGASYVAVSLDPDGSISKIRGKKTKHEPTIELTYTLGEFMAGREIGVSHKASAIEKNRIGSLALDLLGIDIQELKQPGGKIDVVALTEQIAADALDPEVLAVNIKNAVENCRGDERLVKEIDNHLREEVGIDLDGNESDLTRVESVRGVEYSQRVEVLGLSDAKFVSANTYSTRDSRTNQRLDHISVNMKRVDKEGTDSGETLETTTIRKDWPSEEISMTRTIPQLDGSELTCRLDFDGDGNLQRLQKMNLQVEASSNWARNPSGQFEIVPGTQSPIDIKGGLADLGIEKMEDLKSVAIDPDRALREFYVQSTDPARDTIDLSEL